MFLKSDPYRVWCSIFYSKLVNCILLRSLCSTFVLWKVGEHAVVGKETLKFGSIFPHFAFKSTESEVKSPCFYYLWWALPPLIEISATHTILKGNRVALYHQKLLRSHPPCITHPPHPRGNFLGITLTRIYRYVICLQYEVYLLLNCATFEIF